MTRAPSGSGRRAARIDRWLVKLSAVILFLMFASGIVIQLFSLGDPATADVNLVPLMVRLAGGLLVVLLVFLLFTMPREKQ